MADQIYLIRYGDLYKIGRTKSIKTLIKDTKPDEILQTTESKDPDLILARLFRRFKEFRLPESNYFIFSKDKVNLCKKFLNGSENTLLPNSQELYITLAAAILVGLSGFIIFQIFNPPISISLGVSMALGSLPLWLLFLMGNFGGYEVKDLPLFSTWINRFKGLMFAIVISLTAYGLISVRTFL